MKKSIIFILIFSLIAMSNLSLADTMVKESVHSYDMILAYENSVGDIVTVVDKLSEKEFKEYLKDKKSFVKNNYVDLKTVKEKRNKSISQYQLNGNSVDEIVITPFASSATNNIDFGVIETWLSSSNSSNATEYIVNMRLNFQWHDDPVIFYEDAIGLSSNASLSGMTGIRNAKVVYYDNFYRQYTSTNVEINAYGASGKFMMRESCYGYLNFDVFGYKPSVKKNVITMYGKYGHSMMTIGTPKVTLGLNGVTISGILGLTVTSTTQVNSSNTYTY